MSVERMDDVDVDIREISQERKRAGDALSEKERVNNRVERISLLKQICRSNLTVKEGVLIGLSLILLFSSLVSIIVFQDAFIQWHNSRLLTLFGSVTFALGVVLLIFSLLYLLFLVVLFIRYKVVETVSDEDLPNTTVIVPAYNEGKLVYETLLSLADSKYPVSKLQILAIDDGSKDDTWQWLLKAKEVLGDRITILQQPQNRGKRHALYRGFKLGTGDIFVTVDSDSIVNDVTIRNLVSPFVVKDDCGAVAGNVRVLNKQNGLIPKMLNVSFTFSFEFVRSAQSTLGSVFCTPGALAAYRKDAVLSCLEEWLNQTFMGKPSAIGEDRAITNMILRQGFNVYFQKNSLVFTNIPEHYSNLNKMLTRWERSNVRESLMMTKFVFSNFRNGSKSGVRFIFIAEWLKLLTAIPLVIVLFSFIVTHPLFFISSSLSGVLLFSSIQMLFFAKRYNFKESLLAYVYSIYYMFSLFWITPYSIVTVGRSGWLTRELPQ